MGPEALGYLCAGGTIALVAIGLPTAIYLMNKADKARQHAEYQTRVDQAKRARESNMGRAAKDLTGQGGRPGNRRG